MRDMVDVRHCSVALNLSEMHIVAIQRRALILLPPAEHRNKINAHSRRSSPLLLFSDQSDRPP